METISLYELNSLVRDVISTTFCERYWVRAELSEVREAAGGHCFLELVQKDKSGRKMLAKARANIWQSFYILLKPLFERETGRPLSPGIKVLIQVQVEFHELYGYALTVTDIDPSYTLGDMARLRRKILRKLEEEGILNDNKSLKLHTSANRVAVISSPAAAGYGDFCKQLEENEYGFGFSIHLFPAVMQGERTEASILSALEEIMRYDKEHFDVVVIIRGGGAVSDLSGFDTYMLAAACAQFPIPIITGIGHERDDTVLDLVAHTRVKTPTAAASFLIQHQLEAEKLLENLHLRLQNSVKAIIGTQRTGLSVLTARIPSASLHCCGRASYALESIRLRLSAASKHIVSKAEQNLRISVVGLRAAVPVLLQKEQNKLMFLNRRLDAADPKIILKRGYSLTLHNGRIVRSAAELVKGDVITTRLADGKVQSRIE